jgi:cofilin
LGPSAPPYSSLPAHQAETRPPTPPQSSGASVNAECLSKFQELKTGKKIKYIIFGMNADNSEIIVLKESTDQSYDKFLEELPESECRWAVYDMEFDSGEGIRNKLCFYMW